MHQSVEALKNTAPALSIPAVIRDTKPSLVPDLRHEDEQEYQAQVLLVEDEPTLARAYERTLRQHGLQPTCVYDAASALGALRAKQYDVIVSDIMLPDHSGLELLRHVRNSDPDLPMVLVTGTPNLDTAIDAVALGAFRYLVKPVSNDRLIGCIAQARRTRQVARLREEALTSQLATPADDLELEKAFERALEPLWIGYQPIVRWPTPDIFGYQALVRSDEPSLALPSALLSAAQRLNRTRELSHAIWRSVARTARALPEGKRILVRTQLDTLDDPELFASDSPLCNVAKRVALDLGSAPCEGLNLDALDAVERASALGYQFAASWPGVDERGLDELARIAPSILRFSVVPASSESLGKLASARDWCAAHAVQLVVQGVERSQERQRLHEAGCTLFLDCLFTQAGAGRPRG